MRCKNCGLENDDNLYICQNCGSPLYDEADINDDESTVEFKKISGDEEEPDNNNQGGNNNNDNKNDDDEKKKKLTIIIIVLCAVLIAVIAGIIGGAIANKKDDDVTDLSSDISTTIDESTTYENTTIKKETQPTTKAPVAQYMVTVRATKGGNVDGGGQFEKGKRVKITATPNSGNNFLGWYTPNGVRVSQSLSYTFVLNEDVIYEAKFEEVEITQAPTKQETTNSQIATTTSQSEDINNG